MNSLELALLQPLLNYVLDLVEKKYGDRVVALEQQIAALLAAHQGEQKNP